MRQFRFDKVKIDRSFVTDIPSDDGAQAIVRAIVGICRALEMKVIAEGVETIGELDILAHEGCDEVQGYYFCRPVPAQQITELLNGRNGSAKQAGLVHAA